VVILGGWRLVAAVRSGDVRAMERILDAGAPVDATFRGQTALTTAVSLGHGDIVRLLLDRGADPAKASADGKTALDLAQAIGDRVLLRLLLASAAARQDRSSRGSTKSEH
jgi:ankyrin repeat protein